MANKKPTGAEDLQVTKKKKAYGANSPVIGMNGYDLEPGDNTKFLALNIELFNMPSIDMHDEEAVAQRLEEYFALYAKHDIKPTVAGMAIALGWSRQQLWAVTHDQPLGGRGNYCTLPHSVTDVIKKAYRLLENLWENYATNGKLNPVTAIFLAKNNFGYQDKTEYVLTPNTNNDSDIDPDSIKARYLIDSKSDSQK